MISCYTTQLNILLYINIFIFIITISDVFQKNKLKFDAIPTENGPFCTEDGNEDESLAKEFLSTLPFTMDDMDGEIICYEEKVKNLPVKYVDFLTDGAQVDIEEINLKKTEHKPSINIDNHITLQENVIDTTSAMNENSKENVCLPEDNKNKVRIQKRGPNKVKILANKVISDPIKVPLPGNIVNMTPPFVLTEPNKNNSSVITKNNIISKTTIETKKDDIVQKQNISYPIIAQESSEKNDLSNVQTTQNIKQPISLLKSTKNIVQDSQQLTSKINVNNLTPKKKVIIQSKSKLKKNLSEVPVINELHTEKMNLRSKCKDKKSLLDNQVEVLLDDTGDNNSLEKVNLHLKNLEYALLSKIENNTQEILEVKSILLNKSTQQQCLLKKKDSLPTQTVWPEDDHKKYLFNELSEYISQDLKNKLYEELFINKYECNLENKTKCKSKRKKYK